MLKQIMDHFGMEEQIKKLREECLEFLESGEDEEIADVYNVVTGIVNNSPRLQSIAMDKQLRTIDRIETGYYQ